MGLRDLSAVLWKERHLLELLLFKLEEEQLLLASGKNRWLSRATREVEMVLDELRHTELERAVLVSAVAAELGVPADVSLRTLAAEAPPPWCGLLAEHRGAFLSLTEEISSLVQTNRELLSRGHRAVREVLAGVGGTGDGHTGGRGNRFAPQPRPLLIDEAL